MSPVRTGRSRWVVGALGAAGAALLLASCSSGHPRARATTSVPGTSTTTAGSTTTTGPGGPTHCPASSLTVSVLGRQGAAGTLEVTLQLRNSSTATCTLQGYPGAQLYDSGGSPLPTTVVRGGSYSFTSFAPALVTLAPGALAYVNLGYSDVSGGAGGCPAATAMWVTPPDAVDHAVVAGQFVVCGGTLTASPVFGQGSPQTSTTAPAQP